MSRERASRRAFPDADIISLASPRCPASATDLFVTAGPLEVDVGCGRGRFLLARAQSCPRVNFVGIDRMRLRLRKFAFKIAAAGLRNIRLIHGDAVEACARLLATGSIRAFYVFFPDPWPKRRHHRRRLISPAAIDLLYGKLEPRGCLHLATDHAEYFQVIDRMLAADARFERIEPFVPADDEQTDFETIFNKQQQPIYRCSVRRKG